MMKLNHLLQYQTLFSIFQKLIAAERIKLLIVQSVKLKPGIKVLDVGCGFGNLLEYLPKDINYTGVDISQNYINYAKKRYRLRGEFICADVTKLKLERGKFDVIFVSSLFHHLSDVEINRLLKALFLFAKKETMIISADGVYLRRQSLLSKLMLTYDRGKYVRTKESYLDLIEKYFSRTRYKIISNLLNVPVDIIFIWMRK